MLYLKLIKHDAKLQCTEAEFWNVQSDLLLSFIAHFKKASRLQEFTDEKFANAMGRIYNRHFVTREELVTFMASKEGIRNCDGLTRLGVLKMLMTEELAEVL